MDIGLVPALLLYGIAKIFTSQRKKKLKTVRLGFSIEVAKRPRRCKRCSRSISTGTKVLVYKSLDGNNWLQSKNYCKSCSVIAALLIGRTFNTIEKKLIAIGG